MHSRRSFFSHGRRSGLSLLFIAVLASPAAAQLSALSSCRLELAQANAAWFKGYQQQNARCLANPGSNDCLYGGSSPTPLLGDATAAGSNCDLAIAAGATIEELMPGGCPATFWECAEDYEPVTDLRDIRLCHRCRHFGLISKMAFDFEPDTEAANAAEKSCMTALNKGMSKAALAGVKEVVRCAKNSGELPWSCALSSATDTKFGKRLAALPKLVLKCEAALAADGGILERLCKQAIASTADLEQCTRRAALCQACLAVNQALGNSEDCAAFSGDRLCDAALDRNHGRPSGGYLVTNEAGDSVTFVSGETGYTFGDLAASTFPVGDGPVDVDYEMQRATAFVANRGSDTVTALDASTGSALFGSVVASSTAVGDAPSAVATHEALNIVYVANEGDGTLTLLDSFDGSYLHGSLAASTIEVGGAPSALAVDESLDLLYVADAAGDAVVFLRADTGTPYFGTLASSTFAVGDEPRDLDLFVTPAGKQLFVTNHGDGSLTRLVASTGTPANGTLAASTIETGAGALRSAVLDSPYALDFDFRVFSVRRESDAIFAAAEPAHETAGGLLASEDIAAPGAPSDIALSSIPPFRDGVMVALAASDELAFAPVAHDYGLIGVSALEEATIHLPDGAEGMAVLPSTGEVMVAPSGFGTLRYVDPATGSIRDGDTPDGGILAYSDAQDILFSAGSYIGSAHIVLLDGSTGSYLHGTLEASQYDSGCPGSFIRGLAVSDATNTLLVVCPTSLVYLDLLTGQPKTGDLASSTLDTDWGIGSLQVDDASGRAFAMREISVTTSGIVVIDTQSVSYEYGSLAASTFHVSSNYASNSRLALAPSLNRLYRSFTSTGEILFYDMDDLEYQGSSDLGGSGYQDILDLTVDESRDRIYVSRTGIERPGHADRVADVVYLELDGDFVNGSEDNSRISVEIDHYNYYGYPFTVVSDATDTLVVLLTNNDMLGFGDGLLKLDPLQPRPLGTATSFYSRLPVGDSPSSIERITIPSY